MGRTSQKTWSTKSKEKNKVKSKYIAVADDIMRCAQLAAAIEVSGWPKPGNVHRTFDFSDTRFEHFIAGSIALGPVMRQAALRGIDVGLGKLEIEKIGVGRLIKEAVMDVKRWHGGGNTHLGVSLLFSPLAASAGLAYVINGKIDVKSLRENVRKVMVSTSSQDAADVYDTIISVNPTALGRLEGANSPDLKDRDAATKLSEQQFTLYDVMVASSKWDNISREWYSGMQICFETGYPTILNVYQNTNDPNIAVVHTFLTIVHKHPDTLIARKVGIKETPYIAKAVKTGLKKTSWVAETAGKILKMRGLTTERGRRALFEFDQKLQAGKGELNPGTSADLTAASLMIFFLCDFRF